MKTFQKSHTNRDPVTRGVEKVFAEISLTLTITITMLPPDSVLRHVIDAHCHPTDDLNLTSASMEKLKITICAMSSRQSDQPLVRDLATSHPDKVIPAFGQRYSIY